MINNPTTLQYLENPDKSESDNKDYKCMILPNGLKLVLVSDNKTGSNQADEKLSAVALLVDVGAFEQPRNFPGLAHLLEHMIFMGSKKFPEENSFDKHITKFGGYNNACTNSEVTRFYFEVPEKHLDSSMEYFAAQLTEPLFNADSMTREREAVESEFQLSLNDDDTRQYQLIQSFANETFPFDQFVHGNLKSLKEDIESDQELHKSLCAFYRRHYSAHRIFVCIQSCLSLNELECLAVKHFADLINNQLPGLDFSQYNYREAFREEFFDNILYVKSIENVCVLDLTWILPSTLKLYKCKPTDVISHLLGYEGKGSLCAYLRKRLWALVVMAGGDTNPMFTFYRLNIVLTDSGLKNLEQVLAATFAYIKLFNKASELKEIFERVSFIKETNFRYAGEISSIENVQYLVHCLKRFPPKDLLTGSAIYFEFIESEIQMVLDHLNVFRFNIMLTSQQAYNGIEYDKKEKWFGTEYASKKMPAKWLELWQNCEIISELHLPLVNPFIAHDFRIFWRENGCPKLPSLPEKLLQTEQFELWFRQDDKFLLPNAFIYFNVVIPVMRKNGKNSILCGLYMDLVDHHLAEELYPAKEAGINYQVYCTDKGIVIAVDGYNEKLALVIEIVLKALSSTKNLFDEIQLETFKKQSQKEFFNALIKPGIINSDIRTHLLKEKHWLLTENNKYVDDISLADVKLFADQLFEEIYVHALMQGNLQAETALEIMATVMQHLNGGNIKEKSLIEDRVTKVPLGRHKIVCSNLNPADCNTITTVFYQLGEHYLRHECILSVLMTILETPLYDSLRTKQQLGYSVNCSPEVMYGIMGYMIVVKSQETKHSASHVEQCISNFCQGIQTILDELSSEDFENYKNSMIKLKEMKDVTLYEEVCRNWSEIVTEDYVFERLSKEIEILKTLKKQDILDFWLQHNTENIRNLTIQVVGCNTTQQSSAAIDEIVQNNMDLRFIDLSTPETLTITDLAEFKDKLELYPVTKTRI